MAGDEELEMLRRRRLAELQMQLESEQQQNIDDGRRNAEAQAQRQAVLRAILTPEARERLAALRMARPELVADVEQQLLMLASQGRINRQIDDRTMKDLLFKIAPKKREITIERK
ncbi:MAG: DNA-binding protein [Thermoplasmata archaeon]|nr:DNA-binding protein [Candidatus Sysuiplasma acidicola]MBX8637795.1 DNA-binding protein [Candidatus Sysuiplasma acidicola]MBX8646659.1 DNA-binding protein [Candidatus Sysuiplasma acidicola]MDH2905078.1 DNA-binding protein [Methanomassiliicoccales archaeon]